MAFLFTNEAKGMVKKFTLLRNDSLAKDTLLDKAIQTTEIQESVIWELRTFIEENMFPMLEFLEKEKPNLVRRYKIEYGGASI